MNPHCWVTNFAQVPPFGMPLIRRRRPADHFPMLAVTSYTWGLILAFVIAVVIAKIYEWGTPNKD